jgi:hypothetical protein
MDKPVDAELLGIVTINGLGDAIAKTAAAFKKVPLMYVLCDESDWQNASLYVNPRVDNIEGLKLAVADMLQSAMDLRNSRKSGVA